MTMTSFNTKHAVRLALVAAAVSSLAACQRPKPAPTTQAPTATPTQPTGPTGPQTGPVNQGPIPGSTQDFIINAGDRVYFDFDSYDIRSDAGPVLDAQSTWLNRYPTVRVRIEGNADERGTREYNLALGARRANSVRDYLVQRGVSAGRIETVSYGKEQPLDPGTSEDAYQRNRNAHTTLTSGAR